MTFAWKEYLALAQYLQNLEDAGNLSPEFGQEAVSRCVVSRAYYAAFCHGRNYAVGRLGFLAAQYGEDHKALVDHFKDRGMTTVASSIRMLRQWRNQCDYDDVVPSLPSVTKYAISRAQQVINQLK